jgi:methanogenic corrinoid protein MtbC1
MVSDMMEMDGWDTMYLGANMPLDDLLDALREHRPDVLGVSVTMTFNLDQIVKLIQSLRADSLLADIRIMVGGYPFNLEPELWQRIGADGHAHNAEDAVAKANQIMAERK